jgi:hypothetical protein
MSRRQKRTDDWAPLTLDQLLGDGETTAYIHTSIYGFDKHVSRYKTQFQYSTSGVPQALTRQLDDWIKQVKPTAKMVELQLPQLFSKGDGSLSALWDSVKVDLNTLIDSPIIKSLLSIKTTKETVQRKAGAVDRTIYTVRINNKDQVYKTERGATNAILREIDNLQDKDRIVTAEAAQELRDLISGGLEANLSRIQTTAATMARTANTSAGVDPVAILAKLNVVLEVIKSQTALLLDSKHDSFIRTLEGIKSLEDWILKRRSAFSAAGLISEDAIALDLITRNAGVSVTTLGTSASNKLNTADLKLKIEGIRKDIGVSLKQAVNFNKSSVLPESELLKYVDNDAVEDWNKFLKYYKYFILNYSMLYDTYDGNYFGPEVDEVYTLFNMTIGKVFLIQAMLGNIIKHTETTTKFKDTGMGIPYLLVTSDVAVYTYDILHKLKQLLESGTVTINVNVNRPGRAMFQSLRDSKAGKVNYSDILADSKVSSLMTGIYKSAFLSKKVPTFKMHSSITMASLLNDLGNQAVKR